METVWLESPGPNMLSVHCEPEGYGLWVISLRLSKGIEVVMDSWEFQRKYNVSARTTTYSRRRVERIARRMLKRAEKAMRNYHEEKAFDIRPDH